MYTKAPSKLRGCNTLETLDLWLSNFYVALGNHRLQNYVSALVLSSVVLICNGIHSVIEITFIAVFADVNSNIYLDEDMTHPLQSVLYQSDADPTTYYLDEGLTIKVQIHILGEYSV